LLKGVVDKNRPDGSGDDAFPSGHASTAFQSAAFLHRRYGMRTAWPAYALATFVGWSRIDADKHDSSDVLAGAAIGIASSVWLTERYNIATTAYAEDGFVGVRFSRQF
jgi:membrane-associated phospholipid phosphatase